MTLDKQTLCFPSLLNASAILLSPRQLPPTLSTERNLGEQPWGQPATESDLVLCALVTVGTRQRLQQRLPSPPAGDSWSSRYHWFLTLSTMCPHEAKEAVGQRGWVQGRFHPGLRHSFDTYQRVPWARYLTTTCLSFSINKMEITGITTYSSEGERSWYLYLDKFLRQSVLTDVLASILSF